MGARKGMKHYDREFKIGTAKLVIEGGQSVEEVAERLGIAASSVARWVSELKQDGQDGCMPGKGRLRPDDAAFKALEKENKLLRMERDILKKTFGYFVDRPG